jgi:thiamine kinase-like enzyme
MPKLNPYLIENKAQVEEVREIENKELITPEERAKIVDKLVKNEIPSYEEFMKTYEEDEETIDNYYYEIDSHGDISVFKCYGPG